MTDRSPRSGSLLPALTVVGGLLGGLLGWLLARNFFTDTSWLWLVPVLPLATVLAAGSALLVTHRAATSTPAPPGPPPWDHRRGRTDRMVGTGGNRPPDRGPMPTPPDRREPHHRPEPPPAPPDPRPATVRPPAPPPQLPPPPAKVVHRLGGPEPAPPDPTGGRAWWNESARTHRAAPADPPPAPARPLDAYDPERALIAQCPNCGGLRLDVEGDDSDSSFGFRCRRCHHRWRWQVGTPPPPVVVRAVPPPGAGRPTELPAADPVGPGGDSDSDRRT